jgi:hypothetical protein
MAKAGGAVPKTCGGGGRYGGAAGMLFPSKSCVNMVAVVATVALSEGRLEELRETGLGALGIPEVTLPVCGSTTGSGRRLWYVGGTRASEITGSTYVGGAICDVVLDSAGKSSASAEV